MLFTKIVVFIISFYALPGIAVPLEAMKITDGDRVGIYLVTFDPRVSHIIRTLHLYAPSALQPREICTLYQKWGCSILASTCSGNRSLLSI